MVVLSRAYLESVQKARTSLTRTVTHADGAQEVYTYGYGFDVAVWNAAQWGDLSCRTTIRSLTRDRAILTVDIDAVVAAIGGAV